MSYRHGSSNERDRELGRYWEDRFRDWCARYQRTTREIEQIRGAPDVFVAPERFAHEVKHKRPVPMIPYDKKNRHQSVWGFGLEEYRITRFLEYEAATGHTIFYTIHDWSLNAKRDSTTDVLGHWYTQKLDDLLRERSGWIAWDFRSYYGGELTDGQVPGRVFCTTQFEPLERYFAGQLRGLSEL